MAEPSNEIWNLQSAINEGNEQQVYVYLQFTTIDNAQLSQERLLWLLRSAVNNSKDDLIEKLLARKPDLQNAEGGQLLWLALDDTRKDCTFDNNTKIALMLVSAGADFSVKRPRDSSSLLHVLASSVDERRQELALWMIENQADVNCWNAEGETVLHSAVKGCGSVALVKALIQKGATIRPEDSSEFLHMTAFNVYRQELALLMIEHQADVNYRNAEGETVLHSAIKGGKLSLVETLIKKGAKIDNHQNADEQYPLHVACRYLSVEIIQFLLTLGADINATDKNGHTPYWIIIENESYFNSDRATAAKAAMVKHFALSIAMGGTVNRQDLWVSSDLETVVNYSREWRATRMCDNRVVNLPETKKIKLYDGCISELDRMKKLEFIRGVSYYFFLTQNLHKLIGLIRRTQLVDRIKTHLLNSLFVNRDYFPIYHKDLLVKFRTVRKLKKMLADKELELGNVFSGTLPCVVTQIIAQHTCLYEFYGNQCQL